MQAFEFFCRVEGNISIKVYNPNLISFLP